jgi:hypothetical protein
MIHVGSLVITCRRTASEGIPVDLSLCIDKSLITCRHNASEGYSLISRNKLFGAYG